MGFIGKKETSPAPAPIYCFNTKKYSRKICMHLCFYMDGWIESVFGNGRKVLSLSLSLTFNLSEVVRCWIGSFLLFIFPLFWRKCWCCCSCCCWTIKLMIGFYTDETDISFHIVIIIISHVHYSNEKLEEGKCYHQDCKKDIVSPLIHQNNLVFNTCTNLLNYVHMCDFAIITTFVSRKLTVAIQKKLMIMMIIPVWEQQLLKQCI